MPNFAQAVSFLIASLAMTSPATTTTTVVAASSVVSSLERRVSNNKSNKKQGSKNKNEDENETCTMEPFLGRSQYTNCAGEVTEVNIACATADDAATVSTTTTTGLCSYAEQPLQDDDTAAGATPAGCGDHGSFDPQKHLTRDPVTGACRLTFVALFNSCDAVPVVAGGRFGVMVEAPLTTGPGAHDHHEPNEDKNPNDNSELLLRFSDDAGATYYNFMDPRITVRWDRSSPRRNLFEFPWESEKKGVKTGIIYQGTAGEDDICIRPTCEEKFQGWSCDSARGDCIGGDLFNEKKQCVNNAGNSKKTRDKNETFETCFALGKPTGVFRCWSKSRYSMHDRQTPCVPNDDMLNPNLNLRRWYVAQPLENDGTCGEPCGWQGFKQCNLMNHYYWITRAPYSRSRTGNTNSNQ